MIFVTVGTDHHPFDRLIRAVDEIKLKGWLQDEVQIQSGPSLVKSEVCRIQDFFSFEELMEKIEKARIVITHGGPGSIMPVLYRQKIPIVMARKKRFGEAVDDHQKAFVKKLEEAQLILCVKDIIDLEEKIRNYNVYLKNKPSSKIAAKQKERLAQFTEKLEKLCLDLVQKKKR